MRYHETASDFVRTIPKMKPTMMYFKNFITVFFVLLKKCLKIVSLAPTGVPIAIGIAIFYREIWKDGGNMDSEKAQALGS
jgi:hypothetical protein